MTGTGLAIGFAFIGVGISTWGVFATRGLSPELLVAGLLIVLGFALVLLSWRTGLVNPVLSLRAEPDGLIFARRWGPSLRRPWSEPGLVLEVDDLSADPASTADAKRHLFFIGPGSVYGNLAPGDLGPLLDVLRANGLVVQTRQVRERRGRVEHLIRRIKVIRAAPS